MIAPSMPAKSRILPFRAALAELDRVHITEKIAARPTPRPVIHPAPAFGAAPLEEQDSLLNGMTRSLHRRMLGLNLPVSGVRTA